MADHSVALHLVEKLYDIHPTTLMPLQAQQPHWRGIYYLRTDHNTEFVLCMMRPDTVTPPFPSEAQILAHLHACNYPAPCPIPTQTAQLVGATEDWSVLLTSYIHGTPTAATPKALGEIACRLAELHTLPSERGNAPLPDSWWPPATIFATIRQQLAASLERRQWPETLLPVVHVLWEATSSLEAAPNLPITVVHGDCWHYNAITLLEGRIVLIDWDSAGRGHALIDLATLVVASHLDRERPLEVIAQPAYIDSIIRRYTAIRDLTAEEWALLPAAMRFFLAEPAAQHAQAVSTITEEEAFSRKLRVRFAAIEAMITYIQQVSQRFVIDKPERD